MTRKPKSSIAVAAVYVTAMVMSVLDTTIVTVALPTIGREMHAPASSVGVVSVAYPVALTVSIPVSGWLGDRFGGKRTLLCAIGLFTLGSTLCGLAASLPSLIVFTALVAIAVAATIRDTDAAETIRRRALAPAKAGTT